MGLLLLALFTYLLVPLVMHDPTPIVGVLIGAAAFSIMIRAWWLFRVADTALCPTDVTSELIVNDVYRVSRHPMYLGITLMVFGTAIGTGSAAFYTAALANFAVLNQVFCPYEEAKLSRQFGARYRAYARRVRRWI